MDREQLEKLCTTLSSYAIAKELKTSPSTIRRWLKKYDLKTFEPKGPGRKIKEKQIYRCLNCGNQKNKTSSNYGKYCDNKCQVSYEKIKYISDWKQNLIPGCTVNNELSIAIRNHLLEECNHSCSECGWNKRHPVDNLPRVEIDHIDGNSSNCRPENLRVLCPNCHSMTETYGTRNRVSSRPKRLIIKKAL